MQHSPGIPHWKYGMESKLSISNSTHHWKSTLAWNVKCGVEKKFSIPHTWNCNTYVHTYSSLESAKLEHCGELSGIRICIFCCKVRVDWKWKIVERKVVAFLFIYTVCCSYLPGCKLAAEYLLGNFMYEPCFQILYIRPVTPKSSYPYVHKCFPSAH